MELSHISRGQYSHIRNDWTSSLSSLADIEPQFSCLLNSAIIYLQRIFLGNVGIATKYQFLLNISLISSHFKHLMKSLIALLLIKIAFLLIAKSVEIIHYAWCVWRGSWHIHITDHNQANIYANECNK